MSKIEMRGVSKKFMARREELLALCDINLRVEEGEFVCIVGPSGCGKSTIIRIIDDIIKPTAGVVKVDGVTYDNSLPIPRELVRKMGFVFQTSNLYPWLTVRENICLPLKIFGLRGREWAEYADFLIDRAGMAGSADQYPRSLSRGMSQRAGVVRAMVHRPEILLMDEPFGSLDERTRERMNVELLDIWRESGITVIFITHNISEAVLLSQRAYIMAIDPGRVIGDVEIRLKRRDLSALSDYHFVEYCDYINRSIGSIGLEKAI
ncbi:MAG: ABC transporter ATP-binding protein [Synergistaceae bacterium]|nr:ABC transporter ATP-binding protein [Synergistaceae bacterium]